MDCPQCKGYQLGSKEVEIGLVAKSCSKCQGVLLSLMNYGYWAESLCESKELESDIEVAIPEDDSDIKICPKCSRFMIKYRIGLGSENKLDFCAGYDEVWLDKGEWRLLSQLNLKVELPEIFSDTWQRKIRIQQREKLYKDRYINLLGEDDFNKIDEFRQWLNAHPEKNQIKQYIVSFYEEDG